MGCSGRRGGRALGGTTMARPPAAADAARARWTEDQHPQHWSLTMTISRRKHVEQDFMIYSPSGKTKHSDSRIPSILFREDSND